MPTSIATSRISFGMKDDSTLALAIEPSSADLRSLALRDGPLPNSVFATTIFSSTKKPREQAASRLSNTADNR